MARKTVSVCDMCRAKFADYSLRVREATMNVELKLTSTKDKKPGPFDLCERCLDEIVNNIMSGYKGDGQLPCSSRPMDPSMDLPLTSQPGKKTETSSPDKEKTA